MPGFVVRSVRDVFGTGWRIAVPSCVCACPCPPLAWSVGIGELEQNTYSESMRHCIDYTSNGAIVKRDNRNDEADYFLKSVMFSIRIESSIMSCIRTMPSALSRRMMLPLPDSTGMCMCMCRPSIPCTPLTELIPSTPLQILGNFAHHLGRNGRSPLH